MPLEELADAALWSSADLLYHATEHSRYVDVMEVILGLDPMDLEAYTTAAFILWSLGREDEAVAMYTRATQALPDRYEIWFDFGLYYRHHLKDNEKAKGMFLRALQCLPHPNGVERQLAHTYEDLGQYADAFHTWQDLAKLFPEDAAIKKNLAAFLSKHSL
jgi:tetratricopeptide (TPR) repeat protein